MEENFDPKEYWQKRLEKRFGLDGVGYLGLGKAYNNYMYRVRKKVFNKTVKKLKINPTDKAILDIGSGTGFYIDRWRENGAKDITGVDLTPVAVENLSKQYPDHKFHEIDITESVAALGDKKFDVITCFDVLYHVVDEKKFEAAIQNIYSLLNEGGVFIVSDNFVQKEKWKQEHFVLRSLAEFSKELTSAGFEIDQRKPMFYYMNAPVDSNSWFLNKFWNFQTKLIYRGERWGKIVGAMVYPFELLRLTFAKEGPSTELMVCKK